MKPQLSASEAPMRGLNATRVSLRDFLLLHGTLFLYAVVSVLGKYAGVNLAAKAMGATILFMGLEFLALAAYAVLWQQTLKRMPLSFAYSNKGVCTLWACLFGIVFFGESLTLGKAVGIVVVLAGVWLVVSDHE
ncbi:MAG TPA: transporter [Candidatus Limiplasma sp.]|nr:transporter [Candidatus Limiplasma sp.]HPS81105.1 transporter [Candidatus Limiplasma sp.]